MVVGVLALLVCLGMGRAVAQEQRTKAWAFGQAQQWVADYNWVGKCDEGTQIDDFPNAARPGSGYVRASVWYTASAYNCAGTPTRHDSGQWFYDVECPSGVVWDDNTKTCRRASECLDKAPLGNTIIGGAATSVCVAGCLFESQGVPSGTMLGDGSVLTFGGGWKPSGAFCAADPEDPQPEEDEICREQAGNGMTICVKPDGRHCYSTTMAGRHICWNPRETGEKTDGPDKQVRNAGDEPIPPDLTLPSGDTLEPGPSTTTTTTINNTTTTTTTTNYNTIHGTDAGPPQGSNQGEDGEGGDDGDGEGDGEVSGGGDCSMPPSCSGNPLACWSIRHNWRLACEASDSELFGGAMGEVMDAFANEQRAEAVTWGAELGNDGEGDLDSHREIRDIPVEDLDDSGFLPAGKCPAFDTPTVGGKALPINFAPMCDMLSNVGYLVLGLAYFLAFRIIGGGGRK